MNRPNPVLTPQGRQVRILEEQLLTAPLGLRFFDAVLGHPVRSGLEVTARLATGGRPYRATKSSTGAYGFVSLPTTLDAQAGPVTDFGATENYRIEVMDLRNRFIPTVFTVAAPAAGLTELMLFPSANRPLLSGFGLVRGSLRWIDTAEPPGSGKQLKAAAHAAAVISVDGVDHHGFCDRNGELAVLVPFETLGGAGSLATQQIEALLTISFDRHLVTGSSADIPEFPRLASQPVAAVDEGPVFRADHTFLISYQQEVVLTSPARSELIVQPV